MADNPTSSPTRVRNRRGEGSRLREDIVAAAVEILDETGDEKSVTLRSVARRVGIAAPSIYRHFPDQPTIMLAVVQQAFAELVEHLEAAVAAAGDDPRDRLFALCHAYLDFADRHPERYRTMFGGVWMPALDETTLTEADVSSLGDATMGMLVEIMQECVRAGESTSTDLPVDTVAVWLGLHGLAHQRAATVAYPWPPGIADRMVTALAHLKAAP
ncbi:TetR/AcrR family transcriptional regulator [Nocardia sp. NPDC050175]|uniref:TetR/AcrR family transcriptional regulator n=1 Tax=Nocardia sp. NPDC050175 TaxID=3364317 RepID=UPI00378DD41F